MNIQKRFKNSLLLVGLLTLSLLPMAETGCKTKLAPGGAYSQVDTNGVSQPLSGLYSTDVSIDASKRVIQSFLQWEQANRPLVQAQWPGVTSYAIKLSNDAPKWLQSAVALRDAYASNPSAANKSAFDAAMDVLNQAVTEAQKYLAQGAKAKLR
jgi:hypothetical protein